MRMWLVLLAFALTAAGAARAAEPREYRFAAGDVIEVTVTPQKNFDRTVTVQPDGKITYPLVGQIQAAGLTVAQLTEQLRAALNRELVDPEVTVTLKELNKQAVDRVSLLGAVRSPNVYPIKEGTTVAELLAAGGGPTPIADLRRIKITRADSSIVAVDLSGSERTGEVDRNAVLKAGDIVYVPEGPPRTVLVMGEVAKPGSYEIQGEARLLDAISLAGGPTGKADLGKITFGRAGQAGTRTIDLMPLITRGDTSNRDLNLALQPGDTIMVPETDQRIYVLGRVAKPDVYPIRPNDRVLDALARAGGAASDGDASKAVLVRKDASGKAVAKELDLKRMMTGRNMELNVEMLPGDVLVVPDRRQRRSTGDLLNAIWPLSGLLSLFR